MALFPFTWAVIFGRDPDGTLFGQPKKYVEKMQSSYEHMFGEPAKSHYTSPLEPNDHPEMDDSIFLDEDEHAKYLSMIGQLQWLITLGRFNLLPSVTTMPRFRAEPQIGHLQRVQWMYGYLKNRKYNGGAIQYRVEPIEHDIKETAKYDWMHTVYGNVQEILPQDAPPAKGPSIKTTTYCDANLYHCQVTGRALSGILHFLNGTPVDWFCKRQDTVETATYGSEFVVARIATEQIIDLRNTMRYLGVNVDGPSFMFGDNQSVVTSSTIPSSVLNKRSSALCYHRVREAIAAGILNFYHIKGKENPADVLSKHWAMHDVWPQIGPILFWRGAPRDPNEMDKPVKHKSE